MKKILLSALLFLSYSLQSQSYNLTLDNTFGINGVKTSNIRTNSSMNFIPKKCLLINGKYFFYIPKLPNSIITEIWTPHLAQMVFSQ